MLLLGGDAALSDGGSDPGVLSGADRLTLAEGAGASWQRLVEDARSVGAGSVEVAVERRAGVDQRVHRGQVLVENLKAQFDDDWTSVVGLSNAFNMRRCCTIPAAVRGRHDSHTALDGVRTVAHHASPSSGAAD